MKQAQDESLKREKDTEEESEVERIAELRRKGRGKGKSFRSVRTILHVERRDIPKSGRKTLSRSAWVHYSS